MATKITLTGGAFQAPDGTALANGTLQMQINQDCVANAGQILLCSGSAIILTLDSSGNLNSGQAVWSNSDISPNGTFYIVTAYSATNQQVWGPNLQQVPNTANPYNISNWVPNNINPNP